jgi:hypothetical protein
MGLIKMVITMSIVQTLLDGKLGNIVYIIGAFSLGVFLLISLFSIWIMFGTIAFIFATSILAASGFIISQKTASQ